MKHIYLVRHGKTFINRYNKMQGWCDTPLTDEGKTGAEKAGKALHEIPLDIALSSNTLRASETAQIIMGKNCNKDTLELLTSPFFREHFYGYFEGMDSDLAWRMVGAQHGFTSLAEMYQKTSSDQIADWTKEADPYGDAENSQEFWKRWEQGFKLISQLDGADNILLVSHGFAIKTIAERYAVDGIDTSVHPQNASISTLTMSESGQVKMVKYNQLQLF